MLAKTLQQIIEDKLTTAREIGELAGVSTSTVYRWVAGESQPDFNSIRLLLRHLPHPDAQEAILSSFAAGTSWLFTRSELELDVNKDGHIDVDDALEAAIATVKAAGESLENVHTASKSGAMDADDTLHTIALLNRAVSQCTVTQRILVELSEQRRKGGLKLAR